MKKKIRDTILVLFFLNIIQYQNVVGQNIYPNVDNVYSKKQLDSIFQKYQALHDTLGLGYSYLAYAKNEERAGNINNSPITNLRKSMECFQVVKENKGYYNMRGAIGSYLMDRPFMKKFAKEYIGEAVKYFRKQNDPINELGHLINLANINIHDSNFEEAMVMLQRGEMLNQKMKDATNEGRLQSAYSDYYARKGDYKEALIRVEASFEIARRLKITWLEAVSLYIKSKCYENLGNQEARLEALRACESIVEANVNLYQLKKEVYDNLHNYYFIKKNYLKSSEYAIKSKQTVEFIYFSKIESDLRSFSEYNLMEKQRLIVSKIALQKSLTEIELEKAKFRQQMYLGLLILTSISLTLLFIAFINKRRISKLEEIELDKNIHIGTLNALINGQELERQRISQELHDGVGTMLSRIRVLMGKGTSNERITQMIDETCSEVRTISGNLQPHTLENFGLIGALEDFVSRHSIAKPIIIFQHFGQSIDLGMNKNLMIYRIIQELTTNSLKHANANEILIQIVFSNDNFTITVEDDGKGFDEKIGKIDGNGWNNIRSRVNFLQGQLNIHSEMNTDNTGTSVTIVLPNS